MYAQDDHDLECHGERQYNLGAELCEINENKGCGITVACQYHLDDLAIPMANGVLVVMVVPP